MVPWVGLQFVIVAFPGPFFLRHQSYLGSVGFYSDMDVNTGMKLGFLAYL